MRPISRLLSEKNVGAYKMLELQWPEQTPKDRQGIGGRVFTEIGIFLNDYKSKGALIWRDVPLELEDGLRPVMGNKHGGSPRWYTSVNKLGQRDIRRMHRESAFFLWCKTCPLGVQRGTVIDTADNVIEAKKALLPELIHESSDHIVSIDKGLLNTKGPDDVLKVWNQVFFRLPETVQTAFYHKLHAALNQVVYQSNTLMFITHSTWHAKAVCSPEEKGPRVPLKKTDLRADLEVALSKGLLHLPKGRDSC